MCALNAAVLCLYTICSPLVDPPVAQVKVNGSRITSRVVQVLNGTVSRFQCLKNGSTPLTASWSTSVESVDTASVGDDMMLQLTHEEEGNYTCSVNNTQEGLSDQYRLNVLVYGECSQKYGNIGRIIWNSYK